HHPHLRGLPGTKSHRRGVGGARLEPTAPRWDVAGDVEHRLHAVVVVDIEPILLRRVRGIGECIRMWTHGLSAQWGGSEEGAEAEPDDSQRDEPIARHSVLPRVSR